MSTRFLVHWVLPTIVLGVVIGLAVKKQDEEKPRTQPARSDDPWGGSTATPSATAPAERKPRYAAPKEQTPREATLVSAAMKLVYARCSSFAHVFREGANLDGNTVFKSNPTDPDRVNVSVKLDHDEAADGNVLYYMVTFDERGRPTKLQATKDIAANLCELPGRNVDFDLR